MRVLFKILLFPISLVLTVIVAVFGFLIDKFAFVLNIFSGILFLGSLLVFAEYFLGWPFGSPGNTRELYFGIAAIVIAFILSPYGLPTVLAWIIGKLDDLNEAIKSI